EIREGGARARRRSLLERAEIDARRASGNFTLEQHRARQHHRRRGIREQLDVEEGLLELRRGHAWIEGEERIAHVARVEGEPLPVRHERGVVEGHRALARHLHGLPTREARGEGELATARGRGEHLRRGSSLRLDEHEVAHADPERLLCEGEEVGERRVFHEPHGEVEARAPERGERGARRAVGRELTEGNGKRQRVLEDLLGDLLGLAFHLDQHHVLDVRSRPGRVALDVLGRRVPTELCVRVVRRNFHPIDVEAARRGVVVGIHDRDDRGLRHLPPAVAVFVATSTAARGNRYSEVQYRTYYYARDGPP